MRYPIVEQIAQTLVSRLQQVKQSNGFNFDIVSVVRPTRLGGYSPQNQMAVLVQLDPQRAADQTMEAEATIWTQPFQIAIYLTASDKSTTPIDQLINCFRADVETALCTDVSGSSDWWRFADQGDDLAIAAHMNPPQFITSSDGSIEGSLLELVVTYSTKIGDPYAVS